MNERLEILFRLYEEAMAHVRHLEEQRSQFASVIAAVSGGVAAFGLAKGGVQHGCITGLSLMGIGAFGMLLSWKQNEKINFHRRVAIRHRELIGKAPEVANDDLEGIRVNEDKINSRRYWRISIFPVGLFWSLLYAMIYVFGYLVWIHSTD